MNLPTAPAVPDFNRRVHCLLGLPIDALSLAGAVDLLRDRAAARRRCFLSTPNLNFLIACRRDEAFRDSLLASDLCLADGMPLVWIARLLRMPIRERVAGSTVFEALDAEASRRMAIFFFGGMPGVAASACRRLNAGTGGLRCVGHFDPGVGSAAAMSTDEARAAINASGADFLVVSLGARKGQEWIVRNLDGLTVPIVSHLGAVVNFVAGSVRRAPRWMQASGLEWLWRIREEPALWRRYLADGLALAALLVREVLPLALERKLGQRPAVEPTLATCDHEVRVIVLHGDWTEAALTPLRQALADAAATPLGLRLELAAVTAVDGAFIGLLLLAAGHFRRVGKHFEIAGAPATVARTIRRHGAAFLLGGADDAFTTRHDQSRSVDAGTRLNVAVRR
jgi:N-acetylglucosaminyldiphosphoundecaprenol N-acetyl-beta-D-mannosaminyltransferase